MCVISDCLATDESPQPQSQSLPSLVSCRTDRPVREPASSAHQRIIQPLAIELWVNLMQRVLVIDDDLGTRETFRDALRLAGCEVWTAHSGKRGVSLALRLTPDVIVVDLNLVDMSGMAVIRLLRHLRSNASFVLVTGFASLASAVDAIRLGVADYLEKPIGHDQLVNAVSAVLQEARHTDAMPTDTPSNSIRHSAARWAKVVIKAVEAESDPRTIRQWGRCIGVSPGCLRAWCRSAHLSAKRSLNFARVLRAVIRHHREGCPASELLDSVDYRTLSKLLSLGCPSVEQPRELPPNADKFIRTQRWILDSDALSEVRRGLALDTVSTDLNPAP